MAPSLTLAFGPKDLCATTTSDSMHMQFTLTGDAPPTSDSEILQFEQLIGWTLPRDYKEFLSEHRGGFPAPFVSYLQNDRSVDFVIFFCMSKGWRHEGLVRHYHEAEEIFPGCVPFGRDLLGDYLCFCRDRPDLVSVLYGTAIYDLAEGEEYRKLIPVADSFTNFVSTLRPANEVESDEVASIGAKGSAADVIELARRGLLKESKSIHDCTLLEEGVKNGNVTVVRECLRQGMKFGKGLHLAVFNRNEEMIDLLAKQGASWAELDQDGNKPDKYAYRPEIRALCDKLKKAKPR